MTARVEFVRQGLSANNVYWVYVLAESEALTGQVDPIIRTAVRLK